MCGGRGGGRGSITWSQDMAVTNFTVRDHSGRGGWGRGLGFGTCIVSPQIKAIHLLRA